MGIEPGPHWWEASALTIASSLPSQAFKISNMYYDHDSIAFYCADPTTNDKTLNTEPLDKILK